MSFLYSRCMDIVFATFFMMFVFISGVVEMPVCMGDPVQPENPNPFMSASYYWGLKADKIWILQPLWSRVAVCYHAFAIAPFYFLFFVGFFFRWNWIRNFAIGICTAKVYVGAFYMTTNLLHPTNSPAQPFLFVVQSISYMVIPFLCVLRCWAPQPFPDYKRKMKAS